MFAAVLPRLHHSACEPLPPGSATACRLICLEDSCADLGSHPFREAAALLGRRLPNATRETDTTVRPEEKGEGSSRSRAPRDRPLAHVCLG